VSTAVVDLPSVTGLSEQQVRGTACVWCGVILDDTAVDFGAQKAQFAGSETSWFPRGCGRCVADRAYRTLLDHAPLCEQCVDDASTCETGVSLRRLMREGRRR